MRAATSDDALSVGLRRAVGLAFEGHDSSAFDVLGDVRRLSVDGAEFVGKRRLTPAAQREWSCAFAAWQRLNGLEVDGLGRLVVVLPEVVELDGRRSVLVAPYQGVSLAAVGSKVAEIVPLERLEAALQALFDVGIEAPGFVPRNLFVHPRGLAVIDWEDARFGDARLRPSILTLMKWDIAWSDVYQVDPGIRHRSERMLPDEDVEYDEFERWLGSLTLDGSDVRVVGVDATLRSELYVPGVGQPSAAAVGHLAEDILSPGLSVFHTMLTAHARTVAGDAGYAEALRDLWGQVDDGSRRHLGRGATDDELLATAGEWARSLCVVVDRQLQDVDPASGSLAEISAGLVSIASSTGWLVACRRAELAETLVSLLGDLVTAAFGLSGLQLVLRGSLAQGVLGLRSDVDFELSSPAHPCGHRAAEELLIELLGAFGLAAEGSAARPEEADIVGQDGTVTRDLHEWMELRRPGSSFHDPGWVATVLRPDLDRLIRQPSEYEKQGRPATAKYIWFEARALLARLVFQAMHDQRPVRLVDQIAVLPRLVPPVLAEEIADVVVESFHQRETAVPDGGDLARLRERIDALRHCLEVPGPVSWIRATVAEPVSEEIQA